MGLFGVQYCCSELNALGRPFGCYLRIENAKRLCFDHRVFIYMRVPRITKKILNRIA